MINVELTQHQFIALYDAASRRVAALGKTKPKQPAAAMLFNSTQGALDAMKAACPEDQKEVLGLD